MGSFYLLRYLFTFAIFFALKKLFICICCGFKKKNFVHHNVLYTKPYLIADGELDNITEVEETAFNSRLNMEKYQCYMEL